MVTLKALVDYTDSLLSVGQFNDYCPNGLQVEGRPDVQRLVSGVTASLELVEAAIATEADAVLVHHGYFWKGENACITGMKRQRLQRLLGTGTSLLAYHLPLDAHPELGNNTQLAHVLEFERAGCFGDDGGRRSNSRGNWAGRHCTSPDGRR
jgi:putative NIF3 family GTP cyclohydrolase 1 type 2